jgi:probable rRNA maturation factor
MIELDNQTDFNGLPLDIIERITQTLTDKDVELIIVDNETIRELNKTYRGIDKPTDVLSFPLEQTPGAPLGSVVISVEKAKEAAQKLGHSVHDEITLLYIHGLLHLLGYDHETDEGQMRQKEVELIEAFGLPESLIVRNES